MPSRKEKLSGCFLGITADGKVRRIWKYVKGSSTILRDSEGYPDHSVHPSNKNNPKVEVATVFSLSAIEYLPASLLGSESEGQIVKALEEKAKRHRSGHS